MPEPDGPYVAVDCGLLDRLEHWAVRGTAVDVVWDDAGETRRQRARVADVVARDGADWVVLSTGETVRADRLVSAAGP